jgi:hypothetical protein
MWFACVPTVCNAAGVRRAGREGLDDPSPPGHWRRLALEKLFREKSSSRILTILYLQGKMNLRRSLRTTISLIVTMVAAGEVIRGGRGTPRDTSRLWTVVRFPFAGVMDKPERAEPVLDVRTWSAGDGWRLAVGNMETRQYAVGEK